MDRSNLKFTLNLIDKQSIHTEPDGFNVIYTPFNIVYDWHLLCLSILLFDKTYLMSNHSLNSLIMDKWDNNEFENFIKTRGLHAKEAMSKLHGDSVFDLCMYERDMLLCALTRYEYWERLLDIGPLISNGTIEFADTFAPGLGSDIPEDFLKWDTPEQEKKWIKALKRIDNPYRFYDYVDQRETGDNYPVHDATKVTLIMFALYKTAIIANYRGLIPLTDMPEIHNLLHNYKSEKNHLFNNNAIAGNLAVKTMQFQIPNLHFRTIVIFQPY